MRGSTKARCLHFKLQYLMKRLVGSGPHLHSDGGHVVRFGRLQQIIVNDNFFVQYIGFIIKYCIEDANTNR